MASSELALNEMEGNASRIRLLFWIIGPALGLLQALAHRNEIEHDGVAYLDMAGRFLHGDPASLLNSYWSPLYPWLLAHGIRFASLYWESTALHLVNFGIYVVVLLSFDFLLGQILPQAPDGALPEWMLRVFAYAVVLWCCLILTSLGESHPDLLVMAAVFCGAGITARLRNPGVTLIWYALLGAVLGLGYLAKAAMFPLAFVFLAVAIVFARRRLLPHAAALLTFALIAGAYITMLSVAIQRVTFGDSAKINYAMEVNGVGAPVHPKLKIFDHPAIYVYPEHLIGTNPGWDDPSYWREGIEPKFKLARQADVLHRSLDIYFSIFTQLSAVFCGFLVLVLASDTRVTLRRTAGQWPLYVPALAALGMYSLVHVEPRFLGGFVALLCIALFLGIQISREALPIAAAIVLAIVIMLGTQIAWEAGHNFISLAQDTKSADWLTAKELERLGVRRGDQVGIVGEMPSVYWGRLAGVTLTGEISPDDAPAFWGATPEVKTQMAKALADAGIKAFVAQNLPKSVLSDGWSEVGTTDYFVLPVQSKR